MGQFTPRVRAAKDYILNPDSDPIQAITALRGKFANNQFLSGVDAVVRGSFSLTTSIAKGTYRASTNVARTLNKVVKPKQIIRAVLDPLIGTKEMDDVMNFTDQYLASTSQEMQAAGVEISNYMTSYGANFDNPDFKYSGSNVIKSMKTAMLAVTGYNFSVRDMVNQSVVVDIETGGLGKNAPIVQLAMGRVANIPDNLDSAGRAALDAEIKALSPREQVERGFLNMDLLPEAILRDTSSVDASGNIRTPTYKQKAYLPRSAKDFSKVFADWALNTPGYAVKDFYDEFADIVDPNDPDPLARRISDTNMARIQRDMTNQGFVELSNGKRLYSQREATKWFSIFAKRSADRGESLAAANMTFESFRLGKNLSYFFEDKVEIDPSVGKLKNFNLDAETMSDAQKQNLFLNEDPDIIQTFGKALQGHTDLRRSLFMATWKNKNKLNVLDENNYYFVDQFRKMQEEGKANDFISLFPEYARKLGAGLKTFDQQQITKMMFSGLIKLDYLPHTQDIFSGSAIDWASQSILGVEEEHLAFSDVLQQAEIMAKTKQVETVTDIYNMHVASSSSRLSDQVKGIFSAARILIDPKRQAWIEMAGMLRKSNIDIIHPTERTLSGSVVRGPAALGSIRYSGSVVDVLKSYNVDKELLRLNETVDFWTGVGNTAYSPGSTGAQGIEVDVPGYQLEAGDPNLKKGSRVEVLGRSMNVEGTINTPTGKMYTLSDPTAPSANFSVVPETDIYVPASKTIKQEAGRETFNLGIETGRATHQMATPDGRTLNVSYRHHDWSLEEDVREKFHTLTNVAQSRVDPNTGAITMRTLSADEARQSIKSELVDKYAETESIQRSGRTTANMQQRWSYLMGLLSTPIERTAAVDFQMTHGKKAIDASIHSAMRGAISNIAAKAKQDFITPSPQFFKESFSKLGDVVSGKRNLSSVKLSSLAELPEKMLRQTFNIDADMAKMLGKTLGRPMAVAGVIGAGMSMIGADYMIDRPNWKKSTADILRMTGEEKQILEQGHYEKGGNLLSVSTPALPSIQNMNPEGYSLAAIDSNKVDYAIGDGDTVEILSKGFFGLGRKSLGSVRVAGIDTPETSHGAGSGPGEMPFAQQGKQYLSNVMSARTGSQVAIGNRQTFGRSMGVITDESGINYSYQMINEGLGSVLYRETAFDDLVSQKDYNKAEHSARAANRGMWNTPFYSGAQSGIAGIDRKGWNKMTPTNMHRFNFDQSPGTTVQQMEKSQEAITSEPSGNSNFFGYDLGMLNDQNQKAQDRKYLMADMQQMALANSMQKNRGRGKDRR